MIGLHMLHPLQGTAQQGNYVSSSSSAAAAASNQLRHGSSGSISSVNQPNIVRIPAKTASPIISSVPKCRSSKASRLHPIDTVNGVTVSHSDGRAVSKNRNNINQADQVLLIVNDDHIKGGGVPIIGRRLPSKSMAMRSGSHGAEIIQNKPELVQLTKNAIDYSMLPQAIQLDSAKQIQAPVVGRRSHRLIQQQQQQQQLQRAATVYHQAMLDEQMTRQDSVSKKKTTGSSNNNIKYNNQQPLSIVETHLATSQQVHLLSGPSVYIDQQQQQQTNHHLSSNSRSSSGKSKQKLHPVKYQSISIMNIAEPIAEYSLPPMQQVNKGQNYLQASANHQHISYDHGPKASGRGQAITKQFVTRKRTSDGLTLGVVPSSSCSSLCSNTANLNIGSSFANKHINYNPRCCSPATCSSKSDLPFVLDEPCRDPYCQPGEVCQDECDETNCNDPSCNILAQAPSCCIAVPASPVRHQIKQQVVGKTCNKLYNQHYHHHHHHHHHNNHGSHSRQPRSTNNHHHHHHHLCQANGSIGIQKPSAAYRSSSLHDSRGQLNSEQQPPMLISGRNILPVHPKPNLNQSSLLLSQHCNNSLVKTKIIRGTPPSCEDNNNTAVNQMYESLAAELKAKLGDPKMGPILLPPKDYDTMSRKQGKLTGIELRRSTNPQLVGPTASRINATLNMLQSNREDSINEDRIVANGSVRGSVITGSPTGSDRSSGRSQDDRSLQRSRSNSSSGLGSISMGPSSPNSPPISSNEDMRQTNGSQKASVQLYTTTTKINNDSRHHNHNLSVRKNCSPDNCNSSDSGHSGSGRLDSSMSSEERKVSLRDNIKDYLKSPVTSTITSNHANNNNNNNNYNSLSTRNLHETGDDEISGAKPFRTKQNLLDDDNDSEANLKKHNNKSYDKGASSSSVQDKEIKSDKGVNGLNPTKVSNNSSLWNGRVEVPLKVNSGKNGNTYLATKQIIY